MPARRRPPRQRHRPASRHRSPPHRSRLGKLRSQLRRRWRLTALPLVTVNDLNLREEPAAGAKSLGHLAAGTRVFVVQGPKQADGLGWYQVAQESTAILARLCIDARGGAAIGWAAGIQRRSRKRGSRPHRSQCPVDPNLDALVGPRPAGGVACYGNQNAEAEGRGHDSLLRLRRRFVYRAALARLADGRRAYLGNFELVLRFDPGGRVGDVRNTPTSSVSPATSTIPLPRPARSRSTRRLLTHPTSTSNPQDLAYAPMGCRMEFVVDSIKVIGNTGEKCEC